LKFLGNLLFPYGWRRDEGERPEVTNSVAAHAAEGRLYAIKPPLSAFDQALANLESQTS
jgi:hypothetical protein